MQSQKDRTKESPLHHTDLHLLFETRQKSKGTKQALWNGGREHSGLSAKDDSAPCAMGGLDSRHW